MAIAFIRKAAPEKQGEQGNRTSFYFCTIRLQKYLAIRNRGYKNEVRLRGLLKPA